MVDERLQKRFQKAVHFVSEYTEPLPADLLLKLYAYYRIATNNHSSPGSKTPLINAFKANALIQAQNMGIREAMKKYIALVDKDLKKTKGR